MLDIGIFGEQHPRVVQDTIISVLIALQRGNVTEAYQRYQQVSEFFRKFINTDYPALKMDLGLREGLNQLTHVSSLENREAALLLQQEGWYNISRGFSHENPFIPQHFALLICEKN